MKNFKWLLAALVVGITFSSCKKSETFSKEDLIGRWQAPSLSMPEDTLQYLVFQAEIDPEEAEEYRFGYEWDMGDHEGWDDSQGTYEDYLMTPISENGDYHGNGWFKWKLEPNGELTLIHLMHNGGADVVKSYQVTVLTNTALSFKDSFGEIHSFTRVKQ